MPRFLIVEDSSVQMRMIETFIRRNLPNAEVVTATHGMAALETLQTMTVDVVLTDLNMPDMNGLQLVEKLREAHPLLPVILMTSYGNEDIAVKALMTGAASYVPKKAMKRDLIPTLQSVLELARASRSRIRLMSSQVHVVSRFVLENDTTMVQPLVGLVQEHLVRMRTVESRDVTRLGVALTEAILNSIYHGNLEVSSEHRQEDERIFHALVEERRIQHPFSNRRVQVTVDISPEEARFTIRDEGPGFDVKATLDPDREIDLERVGGRGLLLIKSFLDVVYHNATGNEIHLIKYGSGHRPEMGLIDSLADYVHDQGRFPAMAHCHIC